MTDKTLSSAPVEVVPFVRPDACEPIMQSFSAFEECGRVLGADAPDFIGDAAQTLRVVLSTPDTAKAADVDAFREAAVTAEAFALSVVRRLKTGKATQCGGAKQDFLDAHTFLDHARVLTFPVTTKGEGARARWSNPMVNADRIPVTPRAFLWPSRFTEADQAAAENALGALADEITHGLQRFDEKNVKAGLLGEKPEALRKAVFVLDALIRALPLPREQMTRLGREYMTP